MQKIARITISEAEWEVMRVVWANLSVTSREVIDILTDKMDWTESTIKTLIGRLVNKEALKAEKEGRRFIYSARISEKDMMKNYSQDILGRICDTKDIYLVQHIIKDAQLSQKNIQDLIRLLEEKMKTAPEKVTCSCAPGQCDCHLLS